MPHFLSLIVYIFLLSTSIKYGNTCYVCCDVAKLFLVDISTNSINAIARTIQDGEIEMKKEYKPYYESFGLNVVFYRKKKRLTQMKLAELVGVDRSHISAMEVGNVGVSFDVVFKLCEVLEVAPKQLFDFRE